MKSLGDETSEFSVIQESHPLPPGGRRGLMASLDALLSGGGVQKFIVEMGKPIKLFRAVPKVEAAKSEFPTALLEDPDDFYLAARNAVIEPISFERGFSAFEYLWYAFNKMAESGVSPKVVLVPKKDQLTEWIRVPPENSKWLFGVRVIEDKNIPDESMLLVGVDSNDLEKVVLSYRIEMDVPSLQKRKAQ